MRATTDRGVFLPGPVDGIVITPLVPAVLGVDPAVSAVDLQLIAGSDQWPELARVSPVPGFYRLVKPKGGCTRSNVHRLWID